MWLLLVIAYMYSLTPFVNIAKAPIVFLASGNARPGGRTGRREGTKDSRDMSAKAKDPEVE